MLKILLGVFLVLSISCNSNNSGDGNNTQIELGNACTANFDCPDPTLTCQSGSCEQEIAANCKTPAACTTVGRLPFA